MTTRAQLKERENVGTMHHQRIKIIESSSSHKLEKDVNTFLNSLDRAPINIKFGTFGKYYEDSKTPWPQHIAYITFIENE